MKFSTLKNILSHPLNQNRPITALSTFFKRAIAIRIHKYPMIYHFVENTFLVVEKGMSSAELQIYTGLYDFEEMLFLMHVLTKDDTFVDVGANVGVYSVLASGVNQAKSIAFEPIPSTFIRLRRNISYNNIKDLCSLYNIGVGDKKTELIFSNDLDAINHIIVDPNFKGSTINIPVDTLNNLLKDVAPSVLKIDVEGYEANVINGANNILNKESLNAIIIETNGLSEQYEFGQNYIHNLLLEYDFKPYSYNPKKRLLISLEAPGDTNTLYIRNIELVKERLKNSRPIKVNGYNY